jgi:L-amino acid N-acyltransferase YncA
MLSVTAIYGHHVLHSPGTFEIEPPSHDEMARRRSDLFDKGFPYLVAERDGAVVGYAHVGPYRARPAYRYTIESSVYVHPGYVRQGLGRLLMGTLLSECATRTFVRSLRSSATAQTSPRSGFTKSSAFVGLARYNPLALNSSVGWTPF